MDLFDLNKRTFLFIKSNLENLNPNTKLLFVLKFVQYILMETHWFSKIHSFRFLKFEW